MAKQKKRGHQHKGGIMGRSDIPFAQRMRMQQGHNIVVNRERVGQLIARYRDEGIGFLLEGMAAMGFKIVDGVAMLYLDEDGNAYKPKKGELMDGN